MKKPWTDPDKRYGKTLRTIRWHEKIFENGQWITKRKNFYCGDDYRLWVRKFAEISEMLAEQTANSNRALSLDEGLALFMHDRADEVMPNTLRTYRDTIPHFFRFAGPTALLSDQSMTPDRIKDYKAHMESKGFSKSTIFRRLSDLRTFCNWAKAKKYLTASPFALIAEKQKVTGKTFVEKYDPRPRFYTDDELGRIENALANYPYYFRPEYSIGKAERANIKDFLAIVRLGYQAGFRPAEACLLKSNDVLELKDGYGLARVVSCKGGKKRERQVPLPPSVMDVLPEADGLYFRTWCVQTDQGIISNRKKVDDYWDNVRRAAGLESKNGEDSTFYGLRHTYARIYLEHNGMDMKGLADILGHSDYAMIMKVYGFLSQDHLLRNVKRITYSGVTLAYPAKGTPESGILGQIRTDDTNGTIR